MNNILAEHVKLCPVYNTRESKTNDCGSNLYIFSIVNNTEIASLEIIF